MHALCWKDYNSGNLAIKQQIAALPRVYAVTWLDDVIGEANLTSVPLEYLDPALIET
jgi:hypothetical protein